MTSTSSRSPRRSAACEGLLQKCNLWSVRKKAIAGFSSGMRQRFGVAQELIGRPSLLIVDEPIAGLDPEERNRLLNIPSEIAEQVVVIPSRLVAGQTVIHVLADANPGDGFEAVDPGLEDVYFTSIKRAA